MSFHKFAPFVTQIVVCSLPSIAHPSIFDVNLSHLHCFKIFLFTKSGLPARDKFHVVFSCHWQLARGFAFPKHVSDANTLIKKTSTFENCYFVLACCRTNHTLSIPKAESRDCLRHRWLNGWSSECVLVALVAQVVQVVLVAAVMVAAVLVVFYGLVVAIAPVFNFAST